MKQLVIDSSYESLKAIDFDYVKSCGVDGVIFHAGMGCSADQKDPYFEGAYNRAREAGLYTGAYWMNYFRSNEDAEKEAEAFNEVISGMTMELGVYADYEEDTLRYLTDGGYSMDDMASRIIAFMNRLIELGWKKVGWYTNTNCAIYSPYGVEPLDLEKLKPYPMWHACYDGTDDDEQEFRGVTVIGEQWANNLNKPAHLADIGNIDVSTFHFDDLDGRTVDNGTWTRKQAVDVINAMYNGLFGRGYTQGENEALENLLMHEWTRIQVLDDLRASEEYNNNHPDPVKLQLIKDCYMVMRGSEPGADEINFWMQQDEDTIKHGILYSEEFNNKYGV